MAGKVIDSPPVMCPRCGGKVTAYGDPASPFFHVQNYCGQCGAPLTAQAKADQERQKAAVLDAIATEVAERVIERGAVDLGIDLATARALVIRWVKRQP